jgi:hypothetical protein
MLHGVPSSRNPLSVHDVRELPGPIRSTTTSDVLRLCRKAM